MHTCRLRSSAAYATATAAACILLFITASVFTVNNGVSSRGGGGVGNVLYITNTGAPVTEKPLSPEERRTLLTLSPEFRALLNANVRAMTDFYYFTMVNMAYHKILVNFLCNLQAINEGLLQR